MDWVLQKLIECGYDAYAVGGCVRDMLMGNVPHDFDITTDATPEQIIECFSDCPLILAGKKHGTIAVNMYGELIEVTTYRIDGNYGDMRHPDSVTFTSRVEDDLARRDFTINAIAMSKTGDIKDPFCGMRDIEKRIIRCVGDAKIRFGEDALRIMRAMRFASTLGFKIEKNTSDAVHSERMLLCNISPERICSELLKLITGENAAWVCTEYRDVLSVFLDCADEKILSAMGDLPCDTVLRTAALIFSSSKPRECLDFLRVSNALRDEVLLYLTEYEKLYDISMPDLRLMTGRCGEEKMRKMIVFFDFISGKDTEHLSAALDEIKKKNLPCSLRDLAVNGDDIKGMGFSGCEVGKCLLYLLQEVVHGRIPNTYEALCESAKSKRR